MSVPSCTANSPPCRTWSRGMAASRDCFLARTPRAGFSKSGGPNGIRSTPAAPIGDERPLPQSSRTDGSRDGRTMVGPLTIGAGVFVAAVTSGATGQAFPLIAGPFFLLVYPVPEAVGLTAMCSLTGQLFSTAMLRHSIEYQFVGCLIGAGLIGVPLGTALLTDCDPHVVRIVLGLLILLSGIWGLLSPRALSPKFG